MMRSIYHAEEEFDPVGVRRDIQQVTETPDSYQGVPSGTPLLVAY